MKRKIGRRVACGIVDVRTTTRPQGIGCKLFLKAFTVSAHNDGGLSLAKTFEYLDG